MRGALSERVEGLDDHACGPAPPKTLRKYFLFGFRARVDQAERDLLHCSLGTASRRRWECPKASQFLREDCARFRREEEKRHAVAVLLRCQTVDDFMSVASPPQGDTRPRPSKPARSCDFGGVTGASVRQDRNDAASGKKYGGLHRGCDGAAIWERAPPSPARRWGPM